MLYFASILYVRSWSAFVASCHDIILMTIERTADADHLIAFIKTVLRDCVVARRDDHAGQSRYVTTQPRRHSAARLVRRNVMHFVTL